MLIRLLGKLVKGVRPISGRRPPEDAAQPLHIDELVRQGYEYHTSGDLDRAEALYRQILDRDAAHADALYLLGNSREAKGAPDQAISLIQKAIAANPHVAAFHASLAGLYRSTGNLPAAEASLREAVRLDKENAEYLNDLGILLQDQHQLQEALACYENALALNPELAQALYNMGMIYWKQERDNEAAALMERALAMRPDFLDGFLELAKIHVHLGKRDQALECYGKAFSGGSLPDADDDRIVDALFRYGDLLEENKRPAEAVIQFRRAIEIRPDAFYIWVNLGRIYQEDFKQSEEALLCLLEAIRLHPASAQAFSNLGLLLKDMGDCTRAEEVYRIVKERTPGVDWPLWEQSHPYCELEISLALLRHALALNQNAPDSHLNIGVILEILGRYTEALSHYEKSLEIDPNFSHAIFNKGISLLRMGLFEAGWENYEGRFKASTNVLGQRLEAAPLWDGSDLSDQVLLVHYEQGLGDTIQFIRYYKNVAARCRNVIVECQPAVKSLLMEMPGMKNLYAEGEALPKFDYQVPLLSLPRIFGTRLDNIPADIPYIFPDPAKAAAWHSTISPFEGLKVGLVWAGGPAHVGNRFRSCTLSVFAPLAGVPGVTLFSLQKGEPAQEAHNPPAGMRLVNFAENLKDFPDTAALIANLDLVISVDTSVAHLAGAMGKPVWVLIPFWPDWRWMLDRADSPWYPSMRLFRQTRIGDWGAVISEIRQELETFRGPLSE